ncbi:MAG: sigma-70 family RNA polymerase sigma factor [Planctomycetaceae bacterium]
MSELEPPPALTDDAIASGLRRGDREAWTALYDQYSPRVWSFVARLAGPRPECVADIMQDTFLAAARSARSFDPSRGTLWSWLAGIAHHQFQHSTRGDRRYLRSMQDTLRAAGQPAADRPIEQLLQDEQAEQVRLVLRELPADYAILLTGKYIDDLSLAELRQQVGGTLEGVRSRLARARHTFEARFEQLSVHTVSHNPQDSARAIARGPSIEHE